MSATRDLLTMLCTARDRFVSIDAGVMRGNARELFQCRIEEADAAGVRAALHVVIRGGELNEALQEELFIALRNEPVALPRFVRVPELLSVEELYARDE